MKYKDWLKKLNGKDIVQVRMMSTGNDLACEMPAKYGICLVDEGDDDPIDLSATAYSSLGGGFTRTADVEFTVRGAPIMGYFVSREFNRDWRNRKKIRYGFTLKGADKIAYRKALKTAEEIAQSIDANVEDKTSEDLSDYTNNSSLGLERRIHNLKVRLEN